MTDSIIVYRNRTEQAIDSFLYDTGIVAWGVPIVVAFVVGFGLSLTLEATVERFFFRHNYSANVKRYRIWVRRVANVIGAVVAWLTFAYVARPLL